MYNFPDAESPESSDAAFADSSRSPSQIKVVPFRHLFSLVISNNRSNCGTSMSAKAGQKKLLIVIFSQKVERVKKIKCQYLFCLSF